MKHFLFVRAAGEKFVGITCDVINGRPLTLSPITGIVKKFPVVLEDNVGIILKIQKLTKYVVP